MRSLAALALSLFLLVTFPGPILALLAVIVVLRLARWLWRASA
jgi:hypothetical protein